MADPICAAIYTTRRVGGIISSTNQPTPISGLSSSPPSRNRLGESPDSLGNYPNLQTPGNSGEIQPYLADFAWTAVKRINGFVEGNNMWLEFFRLGSWDLARGLLERDPKLWWINRLSVLEGTEDVSSPPDKLQALTDAPVIRSSTPQTDSLKPSSLVLDMVFRLVELCYNYFDAFTFYF
ncbi:hypothetical protein BDN72DRAFT_912356 [Pluteus cervinus]|uniref:Uncharacterized protein n=1 Tax=Pluteus cervinus TaxID=181527 RepID=A0ACD3AR20_9AGAR|nr:hypothetical protein BDN72DRAFT_912356 [Pluteus cervinus]